MSDRFGTRPAYYHASNPAAVRTSLYDVPAYAADAVSLTDYLAFGELWRREHTFLQEVRRVEPACLNEPLPEAELSTAAGHRIVAQFWSELTAAVQRAVGDAAEVVVSLSGGLDSAALAAAAVELVGTERVRAVTLGFERDFEDPEPSLARATCAHLGIRWDFVASDSTRLSADWPVVPIWPAEPRSLARARWDALMPGLDGVILWGLGGDSLLRGDRDHYRQRARRGEWGAIVGDVWESVVVHGRRPAFGLRRRPQPPQAPRPPWLAASAPGFEELCALRRQLPGTWRRGVDELCAPVWAYYFESEAPPNTQRPHRYVYPFFDEALAAFMTTVPTAPWSVDKELLRAALRGRVPESVRLRPKSPQAGEPRVTLDTEIVAQLRAALDTRAGEGFIAQDFVRARLAPGVYAWSDVAPIVRCGAAARWLASLTGETPPASKGDGGS